MAGPNAGRRGRRWRTLVANLRAKHDPCWLCGQAIDYDLPTDDPRSFEADHIRPLSTHPHLAEDPNNLAASHRKCNRSRGNRDPSPGLGATSREW